MPFAARLGDQHNCPLKNPSGEPHIGGPITGSCSPNVLIGGIPAATAGDALICQGPPDSIVTGSATVLINGKPAARVGDITAHGGVILNGMVTVVIG